MINSLLRLLARPILRQVNLQIGVDKADGDPLLTEEALVHAKSEHVGVYMIHFYISARDTVVDCDVPYEIWRELKKGQRGTLSHQGGQFHSFVNRDCGESLCTSKTRRKKGAI